MTNEELNTRNIVCDEESQDSMLEYLYNVASQRENLKSRDNERFPVHFVIFVLDKEKIEKHPISRYFEDAYPLRIHIRVSRRVRGAAAERGARG